MTDYKDKYENNLYEIREQLGMTQEQIAELWGITPRTYGSYERGTEVLPLHRALWIAKKYNYSIDYIYKLAPKEKRTDQFMVDIRDIIKYEKDRISIEIGSSFMKYLYEQEAVKNKNDTSQNKKNEISELDSKFIFEDMDIIDKLVINVSKEKFMSIYKDGNNEIFIALEEDRTGEDNITDEQMKETQDFLESYANSRVIIKNDIE